MVTAARKLKFSMLAGLWLVTCNLRVAVPETKSDSTKTSASMPFTFKATVPGFSLQFIQIWEISNGAAEAGGAPPRPPRKSKGSALVEEGFDAIGFVAERPPPRAPPRRSSRPLAGGTTVWRVTPCCALDPPSIRSKRSFFALCSSL